MANEKNPRRGFKNSARRTCFSFVFFVSATCMLSWVVTMLASGFNTQQYTIDNEFWIVLPFTAILAFSRKWFWVGIVGLAIICVVALLMSPNPSETLSNGGEIAINITLLVVGLPLLWFVLNKVIPAFYAESGPAFDIEQHQQDLEREEHYRQFYKK